MLSEIQEQQSSMRTYQITIKKLQNKADHKDSDIYSLQNQLNDLVSFKKSLEKRLNATGPLSMFDNLKLNKCFF
ncbi:hypothetical protein CFP56_020184 [Quercus suber]|uniref:DUF641 domain-containing protein n=1 Tax=Quercus suber TaxID=58331 RepID=A0AAW0KJH9_QUESU